MKKLTEVFPNDKKTIKKKIAERIGTSFNLASTTSIEGDREPHYHKISNNNNETVVSPEKLAEFIVELFGEFDNKESK